MWKHNPPQNETNNMLRLFLQSIQTYTDQQDTKQLLSTASHLLKYMAVSQNVQLLTEQLLTAPAFWHRPDGGLDLCLQIMTILNDAADATATRQEKTRPRTDRLELHAWARAVLNGVNDKSPRWKHTIIISALIYAFGEREQGRISHYLNDELELLLAQSINLSLNELEVSHSDFAAQTITLAVIHCLPKLSFFHRSLIDFDLLLPHVVNSVFFSNEGLEGGYYLASIEMSLQNTSKNQFLWAANSPSAKYMAKFANRPLNMSLGMVAQFFGWAVHLVRVPDTILNLLNDLEFFSKALVTQWRQNRLSNVDVLEEKLKLHSETFRFLPYLWNVLRYVLFTITMALQDVLSRMIGDTFLASDHQAAGVCEKVLDILRNVYFIAVHYQTETFTPYKFSFLTSIDILSRYPVAAEKYLRKLSTGGRVTHHRLEQTLDRFFLNLAEHFPLVVTSETSAELFIPAARPYIIAMAASSPPHHADPALAPHFEAAHSLMLATLASPQASKFAATEIPAYVDALFNAFPVPLDARQFRLAVRTIMAVAAAPSPLFLAMPHLQHVVLDMLFNRARRVTATLAEKDIIVLTIEDMLPLLPEPLMREYLGFTALLINSVLGKDDNREGKAACRLRLKTVLFEEMGPNLSQSAVSWWTTQGRKEVMGR